jgi:PAS domain S-box-containing protein
MKSRVTSRGLKAQIIERQRADQALRVSEDFNRRIIESVPCGIVQVSLEGAILKANPVAQKVLGLIFDELSRRFVAGFESETFWEDGSICAAQDHPVSKCLATHQAQPATTLGVRLADGRMIWGIFTANPVSDPETGQMTGAVVTFLDITERKHLEEQLRQSQKMEAIGRLAGGIAHDFNNLLTAIIGYSQMLLSRLEAGNPMQEELEEIKKAGERAASLTRQLLAFSRKELLQPQVLDLNELVANLDKMLRRLIGEDIELVTIFGPRLELVEADPAQLEQVVLNLVVNARDAMPQGGKIVIETTNLELDEAYARQHVAVSPGRYVMLAVSDHGCGMDAETLKHIFEPFYTTKHHAEGTGLGLSTVYGVVKQSGGNVWVYSEEGQGTTFKVYLPQVNHVFDIRKTEALSTAVVGGTETVLLAEDEELVRKFVRSILESNGYTVLEAHHGSEALRLALQHPGPIHLLLTDMVMPLMDGKLLAQRMLGLRPGIRVLYMSGYSENAVVHHGVLESGMAFIEKPFTVEMLARKVRESLDTGQPSI